MLDHHNGGRRKKEKEKGLKNEDKDEKYVIRMKVDEKGWDKNLCCWGKVYEKVKGVKEESGSLLIQFDGDLSERVYFDYFSYRVRTYERVLLRCC